MQIVVKILYIGGVCSQAIDFSRWWLTLAHVLPDFFCVDFEQKLLRYRDEI